jgi:hypothetical protein
MTELPAPAPRKITLGFIVGWAFGVLAVITGIVSLAQGQAGPGVAFLLAGCVALPPVNDFVGSQLKISLSGWLRFVIVLVLVGVAGSLLPKARVGENRASDTADTTANQTPSSPPTVQPKTLLDIQGSGTKTTEKFTTQGDDWDLSYSYDCSSFGSQGNFIISVKGGDGSLTEMGVNQLGTQGNDTDHFHTGGTFYLEINSECSWHIIATG